MRSPPKAYSSLHRSGATRVFVYSHSIVLFHSSTERPNAATTVQIL